MPTPTLSTPTNELTPSELGAWRGLLRVHAALFKALDAELETAHGIPLSSYEVLIFLRSAPDHRLRMADLADRVLLSRSGMTRLVDRLERAGWLAREQCSADARGCYAVLTPEGEAFLDEARPTHLEGIRERFLRHFSEEELVAMAERWERVQPGSSQDENLKT
ncbi:MAG: MarR family transcriptional regulator [Solirubrobacterales bacterium]|jgi:DNA-binding MarR family transcriptional regulator|nr:MarR family transcriptional regulator [Solirubrobacterales bacterium]